MFVVYFLFYVVIPIKAIFMRNTIRIRLYQRASIIYLQKFVRYCTIGLRTGGRTVVLRAWCTSGSTLLKRPGFKSWDKAEKIAGLRSFCLQKIGIHSVKVIFGIRYLINTPLSLFFTGFRACPLCLIVPRPLSFPMSLDPQLSELPLSCAE